MEVFETSVSLLSGLQGLLEFPDMKVVVNVRSLAHHHVGESPRNMKLHILLPE